MCLDVEPRCTKNLISQRTQRNLHDESPAQKWRSCPKVDIGTPKLKAKNKDPKHQKCEIWISNANIGIPLISLYKLELRPWAGLSVQLCLAGKPRGVVCELVGLPFPPPVAPCGFPKVSVCPPRSRIWTCMGNTYENTSCYV